MIKPDISKIHRNQLTKKCFSKLYPDYYQYIHNLYPDLDWKEAMYLDLNNISEVPKCKCCGNPCLFIGIHKGYRDYCSKQCSYSDPERTSKIKESMKRLYGVEHALQSDIFKDKSKNTCSSRYNDPSYNNREKMKKTCIELYGGIGNSSEVIKEKMINTRRKNRLINSMVPNQIGYTDTGEWIMKCNKYSLCEDCDGTYIIKSGNYFDRIRLNYEPCTKLNPIANNNIVNTYLERFIKELLDKYNIYYIENDRKVLNGKELDIYIPDKNIAIECNGCFWHNSLFKENIYHINKYKDCRNKGIQLLSIWQDWIYLKPEIIKSIILSKLGIYDKKIYARKCKIIDIDRKTAYKFLNNNHIQGKCNSSINIGLIYDNKLVSLMCFAKRSKMSGSKIINNNEYELVRFCNLLNTQVIGAASKLFSHFTKKYNPHIITSFSCNDISNGKIYEILGFTTDSNIINTYWYIDQSTYKRYHRSHFSKTSLSKKGIDVSNKTEDEVMRELPYWKIYDSGLIKWVKTFMV